MTPEDVISEIYGDVYKDTVEIRNVKTQMRTLFDWEQLDCRKRALAEASDPEIRDLLTKRWQVAYSLLQAGGTSYEDEDVITKFNRIMQMPSIVVDALFLRFNDLCIKEAQLVQLLGEFGETQILQPD